MPTIRDLEDLIIDAIYLDVIRGKLDQKDQQFEVEYTMGRDLASGKIESVLAALQAWWVQPCSRRNDRGVTRLQGKYNFIGPIHP
jgi:hypothetical protein